jgi:hypothetical protein
MAELWAKITNTLKTNKIIIIGVSHHHLSCMKNRTSSPAMLNLLIFFPITDIPVSFYCLRIENDPAFSQCRLRFSSNCDKEAALRPL